LEFSITKTNKESATLIIDKNYYLGESCRRLNNTHHDKTIKTPLFLQIKVKVAKQLNIFFKYK
jgi:hypothetical protein